MTRILLLEIKEEARQDILAASEWYKERRAGLDKKFIAAIEETLSRITKYPEAGPKIYKSFRQAIVKRSVCNRIPGFSRFNHNFPGV